MDGFLSGDIKIPDCEIESNKEESEPEVKQFTCSFCDKTFKSASGLKTHTTKMHLVPNHTQNALQWLWSFLIFKGLEMY